MKVKYPGKQTDINMLIKAGYAKIENGKLVKTEERYNGALQFLFMSEPENTEECKDEI